MENTQIFLRSKLKLDIKWSDRGAQGSDKTVKPLIEPQNHCKTQNTDLRFGNNMCGEFHYSKIPSSNRLFQFIIANAHQLVYREVFAFEHRLEICLHFCDFRVLLLYFARRWILPSAQVNCRVIPTMAARGATVTHVIREGRSSTSLRVHKFAHQTN